MKKAKVILKTVDISDVSDYKGGIDMGRHELADAQWNKIRHLIPTKARKTRGRPQKNNRQVMDGIIWILCTGSSWRDLPQEYGKWQTVFYRYNEYRKSGVFSKILQALQIELNANKKIDWNLVCVDGTIIRAHKSAAGAVKKGIAA